MKNAFLKLSLGVCICLLTAASATAQKKKGPDVSEALKGYFTPATESPATPDGKGFIRRWLLLEPISKPNRSNNVFTDTYTRDAIMHEYFPGQLTVLPKDGDKVKVTMAYQPPVNLNSNRPAVTQNTAAPDSVKATLTWHALDSDHFFVKLFRFATGLDKDRYGVIFWSVTVLNCEEDIKDVRLSIGSNKGAMWWLNGEELLLLAGDRHMGVDSAVSKRVTLKKGRNILRGATINGPGMSEFCARFIDDEGNPVTNYTITCD
ncbi:MAG: acetylxylan esterase [Bacteroidia bacterium]|nr:acetylxylan esterase [Bacteroidia bacterium]